MPTNRFHQQNENSNKPAQGRTFGFPANLLILVRASISNGHNKQ